MIKKNSLILFVALYCLPLTFPNLAQAEGSFWDRFKYGLNPFLSVAMEVAYGPDPEQIADIVKPAFGANGGAVILIHGGGWSADDRLDFAWEAARLAKAGFTVININYRLGKVEKPHTHWPAQLQDVQLAVRYARRYSKELAIDPNRICAYGASAGGHLATFLGYQRTLAPGDQAHFWPEISPSVKCSVNVGGPTNLIHPAIVALLKELPFLGHATPEERMRILREASPFFLISSTSAPTMMVQGKDDEVVPTVLAHELIDRLNAAHVPVVYREIDGGHVYTGTPKAQKKAVENEIVEFLRSQIGGS